MHEDLSTTIMRQIDFLSSVETKVRRVRTPEGARMYGQPIGTVITPDMLAAARKLEGIGGGGGKKPKGKPDTPDAGAIVPESDWTPEVAEEVRRARALGFSDVAVVDNGDDTFDMIAAKPGKKPQRVTIKNTTPDPDPDPDLDQDATPARDPEQDRVDKAELNRLKKGDTDDPEISERIEELEERLGIVPDDVPDVLDTDDDDEWADMSTREREEMLDSLGIPVSDWDQHIELMDDMSTSERDDYMTQIGAKPDAPDADPRASALGAGEDEFVNAGESQRYAILKRNGMTHEDALAAAMSDDDTALEAFRNSQDDAPSPAPPLGYALSQNITSPTGGYGTLKQRIDARGDGRVPMPAGEFPAGDPRNDPEYRDYVDEVNRKIAEARTNGGDTFLANSREIAPGVRVWSPERAAMHDEIISDLMSQYEDVPNEGKAVMMGGLPGAGKSTFLVSHGDKLGLDVQLDDDGDFERIGNAVVINPDDMKTLLMQTYFPNGEPVVPRLDGISDGEMATLVHEESSHLAKMLASRVLAEKKNVVFDITLGNATKARDKYLSNDKGTGALDLGYTVKAAFIDGDMATSLHRAGLRHKRPDRETGARGMSGRYVDYEHILSEAAPPGALAADGTPAKSKNRVEYDSLVADDVFEEAIRFDNATNTFVIDKEPGNDVNDVNDVNDAPDAPGDNAETGTPELVDAIDLLAESVELDATDVPELRNGDSEDQALADVIEKYLADGIDSLSRSDLLDLLDYLRDFDSFSNEDVDFDSIFESNGRAS